MNREPVPPASGIDATPAADAPVGELDLSLIEYCLSLTPAERLKQAEEYAEFILTARSQNGIPWFDSGNF